MSDLYWEWQNGHKDIGKAEGIIDLFNKDYESLQAKLKTAEKSVTICYRINDEIAKDVERLTEALENIKRTGQFIPGASYSLVAIAIEALKREK